MFNIRLRERRKKCGFTQQQMADAINVQLRTYQFYESGDRSPSFDNLVKISDILNVSIDFLLGRDNFLTSIGVDTKMF